MVNVEKILKLNCKFHFSFVVVVCFRALFVRKKRKKKKPGSSEMGKEESWSQLGAERPFQMARGSRGEESSRTRIHIVAADCNWGPRL